MDDLAARLGSIELFLTHGQECHRFWVGENGMLVSRTVPELLNDHEEADTRMILHANHAANEYHAIVIKSPDTDVFVLAVAHKCNIDASLHFVTGSGEKVRAIEIDQICEHLGEDLSSSLIGFHSFTGTVGTFFCFATVYSL